MPNILIQYMINKAASLTDLDNQVNQLINETFELYDSYHYVVDPETSNNIYYQVMVIESNPIIFKRKLYQVLTFTANTSTELEQLVNDHLNNRSAVCIGSTFIANGKWVQSVRNTEP